MLATAESAESRNPPKNAVELGLPLVIRSAKETKTVVAAVESGTVNE
jgi:hypothetical protein